jgi:hypothetical protein
MPRATVTDEQDSPWKEVLEAYFEAFLAFFFPEAHAEIDWSREHVFLDQDLQKLSRHAALGPRAVDKLVQVWLLGGEQAWVLIHVEVQSQRDPSFAERMYVYNYRLFDRYHRRVASLAILADERASFRPSVFSYTLWGCEVSLRFPVVKLLDYRERWAELEASQNPFAVVVMAHLEALRTRGDGLARGEAKLTLVRELHRRGYGAKDVRQLFRFIDWTMTLPAELDREFWTRLDALEEEKRMPYITSIERLGHQRGLEEGRNEGLQEGLRKGLLEAIRMDLEHHFGAEGLALMPELQALEDQALILRVHQALISGASLEEVRRIWRD